MAARKPPPRRWARRSSAKACDAGRPLVASGVDTVATRAFLAAAAQVLEAVESGEGLKPPPRIVFAD